MQLPIKNLKTSATLQQVQDQLLARFADGHMKNAYLFVGPGLIGKSELAMSIGRMIVDKSVWDLDILCLDAEYSKVGIKDLRELQSNLNKSPHGNKKICILRAVETLSVSAINSLLKVLEDTPANVVFFLTCNNLDKLIDTVVSRCQLVKLNNLENYHYDEGNVNFFNKQVLRWEYENNEEFREIYGEFFKGWLAFLQNGDESLFKDLLPNLDRKMLKLFLEILSLDIQSRRANFDMGKYSEALETCMYVRKAIDDNGNIKLGLEVLNLKLSQL